MQSLTEYLHGLKTQSQKYWVLGAMFYLQSRENRREFTSSEIKDSLISARVPKARSVNVSDVLSKAVPMVEYIGGGANGKLWALTPSGETCVRAQLGISAAPVINDIQRLSELTETLTSADVKDYVGEALLCLQSGALRACVVFAWVGAVQGLREMMMLHGAGAVTAAVRKHHQSAKNISSVEDLAYVKESILLLAANELKILDKNEKDILENHCLDVRNKSGHPGRYRPGEKKVSAVIEDLISIVFTKL